MAEWGTPVMLLGKTPQGGGSRSLGRSQGSALGAVQDSVAGVDWGFLLGSYAGAWVGGAAVGYVVGRKPSAALTGGVAASGVWGVGETIAYARSRNPILSGTFLVLGLGSLAFAWMRR